MAANTIRTCTKSFKYRIYPTKTQAKILENWLELSRETFCCTTCGITLDADVNAARNIAGGAAVNRPRIADRIVEFFSHSRQAKAPHFSAG